MGKELLVNPVRCPAFKKHAAENTQVINDVTNQIKPEKDPDDLMLSQICKYPVYSHEDNVKAALTIGTIQKHIREYCHHNHIPESKIETDVNIPESLNHLILYLHCQATRLALGNIRLTASELRKCTKYFPDRRPEELLSAAYDGLYYAAVHWQPWLENIQEKTPKTARKFSTYAVRCIHGMIQRELESTNPEGLNISAYEKFTKYKRNSAELAQLIQSEPSYQEETLFNYVKHISGDQSPISVDSLQTWARKIQSDWRLREDYARFAGRYKYIRDYTDSGSIEAKRQFQYRDDKGEIVLGEENMEEILSADGLHERPTEDQACENISQNEASLMLKTLEQHLSPEDFKILTLYYIEDLTLEKIGGQHNFTKERVRQIIGRSLTLARVLLRNNLISWFD